MGSGHSVYPGYTGYTGFTGYTGLPLSTTYRSPVFHGIGKREAEPEADAYRVYGNLVHPIHSTYTGHSVYPGYTGYTGFTGYTELPLSTTYRSPVFHGIGKREADPQADAYRVYGNFAYSGFPAYSGFNRFNGYHGYNGYYF